MAERLGIRSALSVLVALAVIAGGLIISPVLAAADDPVPDCSYVVNAGDVDLTWTGVSGIDKYVAHRTVDGGSWTWTGAPAAGTTSFVDNLPGNGGTIDGYRMFTKTNGVLSAATVCTDGAGGGGGGNGEVPDCSYVTNANDIALSWTAVTGIDKYVAERTVDGGAWTWTGAPAAGTTTFSDNLPNNGTADGYRMFTKTNGVLSASTVCTDGAGGGGGGSLDAVPTGLYGTTDGTTDVALIWDDSSDPAVTGFEVFRDGTSLGTTTTAAFTDAPGGSGPYTYEVTAYDANGDDSDASESIDVRVETVGTCTATKLPDGVSTIVWENAPTGDIALHDATVDGYLPLKWFSDELSVVGTLDWDTDWGANNPDYRVTAYRPDGTITSQPCTSVAGSTQRYTDLANLGAPVLSDGRVGGSTSNTTLTVIPEVPENTNAGSVSTDALPACSDGGIVYNFFPTPANDKQWITVTVPDGIGVTMDIIHHKDSTDPGNWSGSTNVARLDANGNAFGGFMNHTSILAPYWWDAIGAGDFVQADDFDFFTNTEGATQVYGIEMTNSGGVSIGEATDPGSSFRIEDIKFVNSNDEVIAEPCAQSDQLKCHINGGNFYAEEAFLDDNGNTVGRGCYVYDSCIADADFAWGVPAIGAVAEWACDNDDLLDAALLAGTVFVTATGLIVYGGPAGAGAAIGLVSSMWTCDQSDNPSYAPASGFDDLDGTCVAVETTLGAVFGYAGGAAGTGKFLPTVGFTCAFGAAEEGTNYIAHALLDGNNTELDVTTALTGAGIGCATAGVATGAGNIVSRIRGRAPTTTPAVRNAAPANAPRHPHLVEAEEAASLQDFLASTKRKGNYGEMATDADLFDNGWDVVHNDVVDSLDAPTQRGIDHIYSRPDANGNLEYIIVESKYGTGKLSTTNPATPGGPRIKQMSEDWIQGNNRIRDAVGGDQALADAIDASDYTSVLARIDSTNGQISYVELDALGAEIGVWAP